MAQRIVQVKEVTVLARATHKNNPKVVLYKVLSSDEVTKYDATMYDGTCTSCTCPGWQGRRHCYHGDELVKREAARRYDVVGEAVKVYNRAVADAMIGDSYEVRAEQIAQQQRETDRFYYELATGYNSVPGMY